MTERNVTTTESAETAKTVEIVAIVEAAEAVEVAEVAVDPRLMMMDSLCTIRTVNAVDSNPEANAEKGERVVNAEAAATTTTTTGMERATSSVVAVAAAGEAMTGLKLPRETLRQHQ